MVSSLKPNTVVCFCLFGTFTVVSLTDILVSIACFGSSGSLCDTHRLRCSGPAVIDIINKTYGYRSGCNNAVGISSCPNVCCNETLGDDFKPFISADAVMVKTKCEDQHSCSFHGIRKGDVNNVYNAYSRIEYRCVVKGTGISTTGVSTRSKDGTDISTTGVSTGTKDGTDISTTGVSTGTKDGSIVDDEDGTGAVVGGIIGALVVIGIFLALGFFIFKRKTKQKKFDESINNLKTNISSPTNTEPHYIDIGDIATRSGTTDYDEVDLDDKTDVTVPSGGDYDHIGKDNSKQSCLEKDTYNHIGDGGTGLVDSEDDYHHLRAVNSNHCSETDYNHIGSNKTNTDITDSDEYHHLGNNNKANILTQDNYSHIGPTHTNNIISDNSDYNHI